jgi:hypothetical protein
MSDDLRTIAAEIAKTMLEGMPRCPGNPCDCTASGSCEECHAERAHVILEAYHRRLAGTAPKTDVATTHDPLDYLGYMIGTAAAGIIEAIGMMSESATVFQKYGTGATGHTGEDFQALIARQSLDHTSLVKLLSLPTEKVRK